MSWFFNCFHFITDWPLILKRDSYISGLLGSSATHYLKTVNGILPKRHEVNQHTR